MKGDVWDLYMRATNCKGEEASYSEILDVAKAALAHIDDLEAAAASVGDPNSTSRFEHRIIEGVRLVRTVTTTAWKTA